MTRVTIDYDLMYVLARQIWHLRDEMDIPEGVKHSFEADDIGPRGDTAEALSEFTAAWQKAFTEGWQALTDLGNLLDSTGKAFYDSDAQTAAGAASMAASYERANAKAENAAYRQKRTAAHQQAQAATLEQRQRIAQQRLDPQRQELARRQAALKKEQDAQAKRQEALNKRQEDLQKRQEPLRQRQEELTQRQQELWRRQKAERTALEARFTAREDALEREQAALAQEPNPSRERLEELQRKQLALWEEENAAQKALEGKQEKEQNGLDRERDALNKDYDAFTPERDKLDREQKDLWKDQAATEGAQKQLDKDEELLRQEAEDTQKAIQEHFTEQQEEREKDGKPFLWMPENGEPDPLHIKGGPGEAPPAPEPTTYERDDENGHTKIEYKQNADGEIEVDKNGNPVESTTTITNKNGLTYTENYKAVSGEGSSVTTTHRSDGTVTKVYVDANDDPSFPGGEHSTRYVTDGNGNTLEVWVKEGDHDWRLAQRATYPVGMEEEKSFLDNLFDKFDPFNDIAVTEKEGTLEPEYLKVKPPAYLAVENPMVDVDGKPADAAFSPGKTTTMEGGATHADYTKPDGSALHVVTNGVSRQVADDAGVIQEIWRKNRQGEWRLQDSITQYPEPGGDLPPLGTMNAYWR